MATRNRTGLFLQYRQTFVRTSGTAGRSGLDGPQSETAGLISHTDTIKGPNQVIDMSSLPPVWTDLAKEVEDQMKLIRDRLSTLETLQKKRLMPGFEDLSLIENQIDSTSTEIAKRFHVCQARIKQIAATVSPNATSHEIQMAKNAQTALASKVQDLSQVYRKTQSTYMQKLQGNSGRAKSLYPQSVIGGDLTPVDLGFSGTANMQEVITQQNDAMITQREQEIDSIAKSIQEIALLFKDMQMMVIDQGTVLDRIDYNIEQVGLHTKDGMKELEKGEKQQKSEKKKLIILGLIVLILCMIVVIIYKPKRGSSTTEKPPSQDNGNGTISNNGTTGLRFARRNEFFL